MTTPKRRHVLFLIPTLTGGGAERVITTLLRQLDRGRFTLTLAVLTTEGAAFLHELPEDVAFIDLNCPRLRYALPKLWRLVRAVRPDVVLSTLWHLNVAVAALRPFLPRGISFLAREASCPSKYLGGKFPFAFWKWLYGRSYSKFDRVVCLSAAMKDDLVENFGVPPGRIVVLHNPLDMDRIERQAKQEAALEPAEGNVIRLITAGRLIREKGFDRIIQAVALVGNPSLHLTILGEGPLEAQLRDLANREGVGAQVHFAGFRQNPYAWFARADAFVMSSDFEGLPNAMLEALACGTPVIATPTPGGVREVLANIPEAVLARDMTPQALADAIERMRAGGFPRVSRQALDPFRLEKIVGGYADALGAP